MSVALIVDSQIGEYSSSIFNNRFIGRRRKIRCTFEPGRSSICNECHLRGSICVDQEHGIQESPGILQGEQPYSLRERVTQLEGVIRDILQRVDRVSSGSAMSPVRRVIADDAERGSPPHSLT